MTIEYKDNLKKLQEDRCDILSTKNKLIAKMEETTQQIMYKNFNSTNNNSIYWRPAFDISHAPISPPVIDKKRDSFENFKEIERKDKLSR